jgi:hypothetical protein
MAGGVSCRACGVVLPERVGRCPACGARAGLGRTWAWVLLAIVVAAVVGAWNFLPPRSRVDPALAADVHVLKVVRRASADGKMTDVSGSVENKGEVPVDVVVRFRGLDALGRVVSVVDSEPARDLPPGSSTNIGATMDLTPVQSVEADIVELKLSPK